jgi:hypothetical protein
MSGWTSAAEGATVWAGEDVIDGGQGAGKAEECDVEAGRAGGCVAAVEDGGSCAAAFDLFEDRRRVDEQDRAFVDGFGFDGVTAEV